MADKQDDKARADADKARQDAERQRAGAVQTAQAAQPPVRPAQPRNADTDNVNVDVPQSFVLVDDKGRRFSVDRSHSVLPRWMADHWYAKANGVRVLGSTDEDIAAAQGAGHPAPLPTIQPGASYPNPNDQAAASLPIGPGDGNHPLEAAAMPPDQAAAPGMPQPRDVAGDRAALQPGAAAMAGVGGPQNQEEAETLRQEQERQAQEQQRQREAEEKKASSKK